MANKKLTRKELDTLKEIQQKNAAVVSELGNLEMAKLQMESRKSEIIKFYNDLKEEEAEFGKTLSEKYGTGTINIDKGEFVPSEETAEVPVLE